MNCHPKGKRFPLWQKNEDDLFAERKAKEKFRGHGRAT
jgi:hypothetical protein